MRATSFRLRGVAAFAALATACADPRQAEVIVRQLEPLVWNGERQLEASDAAEFDQLGYSVSLTDERALAGAYGNDAYRGSAYVFVRNGSDWAEEQKLVPSDGAGGDAFGYSVSLSEDRALVAAYGDDSYRGSAYVFVRSGSAWTEEQKLVASDGAEGDNFGWSVALAGDRAIVGAFSNDTATGAAYVFERNGSAWTEEQKLVPEDAAEGDKLGYSVSLGDDRALVGAPGNDDDRGAAHVFVRDGSAWTEEQQLSLRDGESSDHLGLSVSLAGDRALLGSYGDYLRGRAHVFLRDGSAWTEEQELVASDGASGHRFGSATSLGPDRALIGAPVHDASGAAYVFVRNGNAWTEEQRLTASDRVESDLFGWSVSLASDSALIGAHAVDNLRGKAYVYSLGLEKGEPCFSDPDCASGHCAYERCCDVEDGSCLRVESDPAANGNFCASGGTCESGHCADGVCCDAACEGTCEACTAALKGGGGDGACGHVAVGLNPLRSALDPTPDCTADAACPVAASCNGRGECGECVSTATAIVEGGGLACHMGSSPGHARAAWLGAALLLLLVYRRRRPDGSDPR